MTAKAKSKRQPALLCAGLFVLVATAAICLVLAFPARPKLPVPSSSLTIELPAANVLRPISPDEALRENADRSFSQRPDSPAAPFKFAGDSTARERAVQCLSQAVYYEAAGDGSDAERAVAQVVLNRVRHPGYPSTICGVVYEGSDRPNCQFTFACDGSLARIPAPVPWKKAQQIALEGLNGRVFAPVGHATHYHADYVLPYWADSLDKSVQIGQQIFYRLKGSYGEAAAFSQRYAREEPPLPAAPSIGGVGAVPIDPATLPPPGPATDDLLIADKLARPPDGARDLVADAAPGALIADQGAAPGREMKRAAPTGTSNCSSNKGPVQLRPLSANDMHADKSPECP